MPLPRETLELLDAFAFKLAGYLRKLTGYVYNPNEEFFQYEQTIRFPTTGAATAVAAGDQFNGVLTIDQASDFIATNMSAALENISVSTTTTTGLGSIVVAVSPTVAAAGTNGGLIGPAFGPPPVDYLIVDSSSDRQLSNENINAYAGMGIGMLPRTFPKPRLFKGNTNIRITIRPRFAISAGAFNFFLVFTGYKKFHLGGSNLTSRR